MLSYDAEFTQYTSSISEICTSSSPSFSDIYAISAAAADIVSCFLAENPNRVYTKEELFKEIWDMESIGDIATVTVHIKKIREKIEFNTAKPQYIETIWGVGYRFKV